MIQFEFSIFYVDSEGDDKLAKVKAALQSDAKNKFVALDSSKGYKSIIQIKKGSVVPPSETEEE